MSKHNGSIPPTLKNGTGARKRPNAQKHGVFASAPIIPGEDPREFQELLAELIDEWNPTTPSQRDAVFDLAETKWRKRRLKKAIQTELYIYTFDPAHPGFNEVWGFHMFLRYLRTRPERALDYAEKCLRPGTINYLNRKFPRSKYQSTPEWVQAVTKEILSVLLPATPGYGPQPQLSDLETAARQWETDQQVAASMVHARELLEYDLKQTERLDATIARQVKFLVELKTMQQILARDIERASTLLMAFALPRRDFQIAMAAVAAATNRRSAVVKMNPGAQERTASISALGPGRLFLRSTSSLQNQLNAKQVLAGQFVTGGQHWLNAHSRNDEMDLGCTLLSKLAKIAYVKIETKNYCGINRLLF